MQSLHLRKEILPTVTDFNYLLIGANNMVAMDLSFCY